MAAALLLDLLIFLVPLLLIPLGLWRGGAHEGLVGGGILLGGAVASYWTGSWGGWLASLFDAPLNAMAFLVACVLLVIGAAAGHAAGTVVGLPRPEADGRIAGAVLGWLNGVVFLTLALGAYGSSVGSGALTPIIARGFLTEAVIVHGRWVLLGSALVVLGMIGTVFWVNAVVGHVYDPGYVPGQRTVFTSNPAPDRPERPAPAARTDPRLPIAEPYSNWPMAPRQRPIAVPRMADAGKVEPAASRFRSALSRMGPQPDAERGRTGGFRELFSQTLPVDLRSRSEDDQAADATARPAPDAPGRSASSRASRATPRPHPVTGRTPDDLSTSDPGAPARPAPPASISDWIRVSGLSNPMMAPPPKTGTSARPETDGSSVEPAADAPIHPTTGDDGQPGTGPDRGGRSSGS